MNQVYSMRINTISSTDLIVTSPDGTAQHETLATWELTGRRQSVAETKARPS